MTEQWKMICRVKEIPQPGPRLVQRGLGWQELPAVALFRTEDEQVYALLDGVPHQQWQLALAAGQTRAYTVRIDDGRVYLDLNELNAPASKAEAALAGSYGMAPQVLALG